jgi:signal transduction histidine kinase/DNA-binding response OmpR family regulator
MSFSVLLSLSAITAYAGVFHFVYSLLRPESKDNRNFAYVCFAVALYGWVTRQLYLATSYSDAFPLQQAQFSIIALVSILFLYYVQHLTHTKPKPFLTAYYFLISLFVVLPWLEHEWLLHLSSRAPKFFDFWGHQYQVYEATPGILLIFEYALLFVGIVLCYVLLIPWHKRMKSNNQQGLLLIIGFTIFLIAGLSDIFTGLDLWSVPYSGEYAFFVLVLIMDYTLLQSIVQAFAREKHLNLLLDKTVQERTKELRMVNHELAEAKDRSDKANKSKSAFLANMSHEIRTPMNGVVGMTHLLLRTNLDDDQYQYTETIRSSADTLLSIINDILDFSKIEAGKLELETIPFDLHELFEEFVGMMSIRMQDKNLEFVCGIDANVPRRLVGDPVRLRQVLTNLVANAEKFTTKGEIEVRIKLRQKGAGRAQLYFSVRDTGIGVPIYQQSKLFDAFVQADTSTTREFGGSGLGLTICKQLVQLMDGEIGVRSGDGNGSVFYFTAQFLTTDDAVEPDRPELLKGVRVLVVDDNETNCALLQRLLGSWGMDVEYTNTGDKALGLMSMAKQEHKPFSIAVLDMQMPGMDGKALGKAIKAIPSISDCKLILLSSLGIAFHKQSKEELRSAGFVESVLKPVRESVLKKILLQAVASDTNQSLEGAQNLGTKGRSKKHIGHLLVVEDNLENQQVAQFLLEDEGFLVDLASSGREALEKVQAHSYSAVLMDVMMPEMDGYQTTQLIRTLPPPVNDIPIIALTALAMRGDREKCLQAGMNDYVTKPINSAEIVQVVQKYL